MSRIKEYLEIIAIDCNDCDGAGFIFIGDDNNYDVTPCSCVTDGDLFLGEAE
jgi:hypothetical protein